MHPYNSLLYWEQLMKERNVWQGLVTPELQTERKLFINSTIVSPNKKLFCNDWACYKSPYALLGFLQYVYLPTAFYTLLHEEYDKLCTPLITQQALFEELETSQNKYAALMIYFLQTVNSMWNIAPPHLYTALKDFCEIFNNAWMGKGMVFRIDIYESEEALYRRIQQIYWHLPVFEEETGMPFQTFYALCRMAKEEAFYQELLLRFLNQNFI